MKVRRLSEGTPLKQKRRLLGHVQALVLQTVIAMQEEAYGARIQRHLVELTGQNYSLGQIHSALSRMESAGLISASSTPPTPVRGGRRKRVYTVNAPGRRALENYLAVTASIIDSNGRSLNGQKNRTRRPGDTCPA